jgi:hypothetical protein
VRVHADLEEDEVEILIGLKPVERHGGGDGEDVSFEWSRVCGTLAGRGRLTRCATVVGRTRSSSGPSGVLPDGEN